MKKTIKEDKARKVIKESLINDNTLLEFVEENDYIVLGTRYVEYNQTIKEDILAYYTKEQYENELDNLLKINDTKKLLAFFKKKDNEYILSKIYDVENHFPIYYDFIDVVFNKEFKDEIVNEYYVLQKKK